MSVVERPESVDVKFGPPDSISEAEWDSRIRLAAAYHIFDYLGWTETIYGHITLKVPGSEPHFLINPYGLRYDEVCASNLVKIDYQGNVIGYSDYLVNQAGYIIHGAIHAAREDVHCVMHTHTTAGMAVAAQQQGLLSINIQSTGFYERVAYHEYEGPSMNPDEKQRLVASLGPEKKVLILRNHGLVTCGDTLEEAFILLFRLQRACEVQIAAQAGGAVLTIPSHDVCTRAAKLTDEFLNDNNGLPIGKLEFNSYVRLMDKLQHDFRR